MHQGAGAVSWRIGSTRQWSLRRPLDGRRREGWHSKCIVVDLDWLFRKEHLGMRALGNGLQTADSSAEDLCCETPPKADLR